MMLRTIILLGAVVTVTGTATTPASAFEHCYFQPLRRAELYNWNQNYANTAYGAPVALVVPPTANMQSSWGWGVGSSRLSRIDHQFGRNYPGAGSFGGPFHHTPAWPQDTAQFGTYSVRGPW